MTVAGTVWDSLVGYCVQEARDYGAGVHSAAGALL